MLNNVPEMERTCHLGHAILLGGTALMKQPDWELGWPLEAVEGEKQRQRDGLLSIC